MKTTRQALMQGFRIRTLAIVVAILGTTSIHSASSAFSALVVFGDSLSDTGNFYRLTGYPAPPYADGRFSNGPLWVEYLANDLGLDPSSGENYAMAGATTGYINTNDRTGIHFPALQDELAAFLANHPDGADPNALYVLWAGANDFFLTLETAGSPAELISNGIANTVQTIALLHTAGAKYILVPNVPDLGVTPYALSVDAGPAVTQLAATYNHFLAQALQGLASAGIPTIDVDAFSTLDSMVYSPEQYGFTEVADAYIYTGGDVSGFVFWDLVHPCTRAHEVLEGEAVKRLTEYFSSSQGKVTPKARVNSLKGLVKAQ